MFHQTCEPRPNIAHLRKVDITYVEYNAFSYRKIIKIVVLDRYSLLTGGLLRRLDCMYLMGLVPVLYMIQISIFNEEKVYNLPGET